MKTTERDTYICQDYSDGKEISELARSYGISDRRVAQILRANEVQLRPRTTEEKKPLSPLHVRLGMHLYNYRFNRGLEPYDAATEMGWSMLKVRKVEKGVTELELLELIDIAKYTQTTLDEILSSTNRN
ncbi:hypothetical protein [Ruegeria sp. HKCCD7303]|uniref:hypothetical protein n=1 Tax=Ruegeria sp. HKCCD7303 TaxID=2683013 RepID=UPI001491B0C6|nr:hypothetical protein [Ruegeria sp. HKCCD7303]NOD70158.1 hypothetical protein [Ruegeria sp. HKCCD7303]